MFFRYVFDRFANLYWVRAERNLCTIKFRLIFYVGGVTPLWRQNVYVIIVRVTTEQRVHSNGVALVIAQQRVVVPARRKLVQYTHSGS